MGFPARQGGYPQFAGWFIFEGKDPKRMRSRATPMTSWKHLGPSCYGMILTSEEFDCRVSKIGYGKIEDLQDLFAEGNS